MRRLYPLFILSFLSLILSGQVESELLRYARQNPAGTARSVALGGAFGALGGDYSSALQNPAGLGVYRSSELSFTPEIYYNGTSSTYAGMSRDDFAYSSQISHLSYVAAFKFRNSDWVGGSFALGFNNLNNFYSNIRIEGDGIHSSMVDQHVNLANYGAGGDFVEPYNLNAYSTKLFFDGYIIDWDEAGNYFLNTDIRDAGGNININQTNTIERSGKMNEWSLSIGLNFKHKLYLGASASMIPVNFSEFSVFSESDAAQGNQEYFRYNEMRLEDGNGFNGKVGLIYKPMKILRLGLAYHTPTVFRMNSAYYSSLDSYIEGTVYPIDAEGYELDDSLSDYRIKTPSKTIGSIGLMLGKFILVTSDIELTDYSGMRMYDRSDTRSFDANHFGYALNVKNGIELRINQFYLRGGFAYYGSPYKPGLSYMSAAQYTYSGGLGIRGQRYFLDFALSYSDVESASILYNSPYVNTAATAAINSNSVRALMTLGIRLK